MHILMELEDLDQVEKMLEHMRLENAAIVQQDGLLLSQWKMIAVSRPQEKDLTLPFCNSCIAQ